MTSLAYFSMRALTIFILFTLTSICFSEEASEYKNQGFIKDIPERISNKFKACEQFLDIKWLNIQEGIGYVKHDLYEKGEYAGNIEALIYINSPENRDRRHHDKLDLYSYKKEGKLEMLYEAIEKGKVESRLNYSSPNVVYQGKWYHLGGRHNEKTYTNNTATVCVLYPDESKAWFVEHKAALSALTPEKMESYRQEWLRYYPRYKPEWVDRQFVLNLNNDSKDDLYSTNLMPFFLLSSKEDFTLFKVFDSDNWVGGKHWSLGIEGQHVYCEIKTNTPHVFITYDGDDFFANNQCNLSGLEEN